MEIGTRDIMASDMKAWSLYKQESIEHLRAKPGLIKWCINEAIPLFKYLKDQWDEKTEAGIVLSIQCCICAVAPEWYQYPDTPVISSFIV